MMRRGPKARSSSTDTTHDSGPVPLSWIAAGQKGLIRQLKGGREFSRRVVALGFTLGAEVTVIQNYGRGPMMVSVRDSQVALGRGEAAKIVVEVV